MDFVEKIASRIRFLMETEQITEKELIEKVRCTKKDVKEILRVRNKEIKTIHLLYICIALNISLHKFFDFSEFDLSKEKVK